MWLRDLPVVGPPIYKKNANLKSLNHIQLFENDTLIQNYTILHTVLSRSFAPRTGCQPNTQSRVGLSSVPLLDLAPERVSNRMKLLPAPLRVSGFAV